MTPRTQDKSLGLLLAPGAGAGRDQPALVAIDRVASDVGVNVVRMDFPYRKAGRRSPDRPQVLLDAVVNEATELRRRVHRLVLGGRSMGGRICSMAVAGGLEAAGLVLVSYPLHPPGRPERRRDEHFSSIGAPCLFVSGTRDQFGTPDELEAAIRLISAPVTHHWIDNKDHALRGADSMVSEQVVRWLEDTGLLG